MFSVYIIFSQKIDKFYIGFTSDVNDRLLKHNRSKKGFTALGQPWVLVYSESFHSKSAALKREKQLKNWKNRERLIALIKSGSVHPD
jgi:putative endonuclease